MKGILFKQESIKAIIEGRKTQTRRVITHLSVPNSDIESLQEYRLVPLVDKPFQDVPEGFYALLKCNANQNNSTIYFRPRYQPGGVVYIKETWCESYYGESICYKLDGNESPGPKGFWRSPMFLKAINARYFIKITDVRVERLQEITEEDAIAEGITRSSWEYSIAPYRSYIHKGVNAGRSIAVAAYMDLWNSINPRYPWGSNPWVFVYSFKLARRLK